MGIKHCSPAPRAEWEQGDGSITICTRVCRVTVLRVQSLGSLHPAQECLELHRDGPAPFSLHLFDKSLKGFREHHLYTFLKL